MKLRVPVRHYCRYPFEDPAGHVEGTEELELERTALLVVDVYGLGFDEGDAVPEHPPLFLQKLHAMQSEIMRNSIRPAIDAARAAGLPVVYVENEWKASCWQASEFGHLVRRTEDPGDFDEVFVGTAYNHYSDVVAPRPDDIVVQKTMYDGFFETTLDTVLRNLDVKYLVCVGFTADICLLNTVIGAMYRNYRVIVLRDCTLAAEFADTVEGLEMTRLAVRYYEAMVGFTSTAPAFIEACERVSTTVRAAS
jgi:ureidoacrylate peracid hydrolase